MAIRYWGGEKFANTTKEDPQSAPSLAALADGGFILAWQDYSGPSGISIKYQRFDAGGAAVGGETTVPFQSDKKAMNPSVIALANGDFVIAAEYTFFTDDSDLFAFRYNSSGVIQGSIFAISNGNADENDVDLARLGTGFVSVFSIGESLYRRTFSGDGVANGASQLINIGGTGEGFGPQVAQLTSFRREGFVATWTDPNNGNVYARLYDALGVASNNPFQVNSVPVPAQNLGHASVTGLAGGRFVVSFSPYHDAYPGTGNDISARLFDPYGNPIGNDFAVNAGTDGSELFSQLVALRSGGFVAIWEETVDTHSVYGQIFNEDAQKIGTQFRISTNPISFSLDIGVVELNDGRLVVSWEAPDGSSSDGNGIAYQIIDPREGYVEGTDASEPLYGSDTYGDQISGFAGDDQLYGMKGDDFLYGGNGSDTLDGGAGADELHGGRDDDTYIVDNGGDLIFEGKDEGLADVVKSSVSYALASGVYIEQLMTTNAAGTVAINLTGNELAQTIIGNAAVNNLSDGGGAGDVLKGLGGNDIYRVASAATTIVETSSQGTADVVLASTSYTLGKGVYVEFLQTNSSTGTAAINLTGNELSQTIIGNAGINSLSDGGGVGDVLKGLGGNDIYRIASAATTIVETSSQGTADVVLASVSFKLNAGAYVEFLQTNSTAGTTAIDLTGNEVAQTLVGNAGANRLDGAGGADTLTGRDGKDTFVFSSALNLGVDTITDFKAVDDTIELSKAVFGALSLGTLSTAAFTANTTGAATDSLDRIIYQTTTGKLFYDTDGTGTGAAAIHFATLTGQPAITNADFVVVT